MNYETSPKQFKRLVDDNHARFQERSYADKILEILNKQDLAKKYTVGFEDHKYSLNLLEISISNNATNEKYELKVHRTDATTNIHIKPKPCINPSITKGVFKGFLHRANTVCSEKYIKKEMQFLVDMSVENGYTLL